MQRHMALAHLNEQQWVDQWAAPYAARHGVWMLTPRPRLSLGTWLLALGLFALSIITQLRDYFPDDEPDEPV
jgi:hypothetical protein